MTNCKNCGHGSHCGAILKKDLQGEGEAIQICQTCRCERCDNENPISES
jgi:hypothetical protein